VRTRVESDSRCRGNSYCQVVDRKQGQGPADATKVYAIVGLYHVWLNANAPRFHQPTPSRSSATAIRIRILPCRPLPSSRPASTRTRICLHSKCQHPQLMGK
jgi:hypothetical protein